MPPNLINEWVTVCGTGLALAAGGVAFFRKARKWTRKQRARVLLLDSLDRAHARFSERFGEDYPSSIHDILTDLGNASDIHAAHQDILLRRLKLGAYICDASGQCLSVNRQLAEIFGVQASAMLGYGWAAQISDRTQRVEYWNWCVEHKATYRDEYTVTHGVTGAQVRCRTEADYFAVDGGRFIGFVEVIQ